MKPKYVAIGYTPVYDSPGDLPGWYIITWEPRKDKAIAQAKQAQKEWARHVVVVRLDKDNVVYEKDIS